MKNGVAAALLVLVVVVSVGTGYLVGGANLRITTSVSTTTLSTAYVFRGGVFTMNVNGSLFYADNISGDMVVQNPGYAYFMNGSVTFDGVKFETICLPNYSGCPIPAGTVQNQTRTVPGAGAITIKMTFPDKNTETRGEVIGDSTYVFVLSQHANPRAGVLIEYIEYNYPHNFPPYKAFLLVSTPSCCG